MSISPLSESTARAIGSSSVLNDAASVVKELIDNALDARATHIAVELSTNTLDVIQVKDNGTGIGLEDRQLICKRGCTSKIRTIADLENLGGTFLGFRGEALAIIAELSEEVNIITCVEGERVATSLKFGPSGALLSSRSASHPIGTTIRVQDFLKFIPVRKQTAIKAASKTLAGIKKLLFDYAFARPTIRFSVKVLKSKSEKSNWLYAGTTGSTLLDAAAKILGKEVAAQCERRILQGKRERLDQVYPAFEIDALLLRNAEDASKIQSPGHFISIDGRPVRSDRGSTREIVKSYKTYFRNLLPPHTESTSFADPFLCMHIRCPAGSYDVNIEPAKDEVLFLDINKITSLAEQLFLEFYGSLSSTERLTKGRQMSEAVVKPAAFDLLMAKKPVKKGETADRGLPHTLQGEEEKQDTRTGGKVTESEGLKVIDSDGHGYLFRMVEASTDADIAKGFDSMDSTYDEHFRELEMPASTLNMHPAQDNTHNLAKSPFLNPWSLAQINAPLPRRPASPCRTSTDSAEPITPTATVFDTSSRSAPSSHSHRIPLCRSSLLPTPSVSPQSQLTSQIIGPSCPGQGLLGPPNGPGDETELIQESTVTKLDGRDGRGLGVWTKPSKSTIQLPSFQRPHNVCNRDGRFGASPPNRVESRPGLVGKDSPSRRLTSPLPTDSMIGESVRKPFRSPLKASAIQNSPIDSLEHMARQGRLGTTVYPGLGHVRRSPAELTENLRSMPPPPSPSHPPFITSRSLGDELTQIMDFEHRKKEVVKQQRQGQLKLTRPFLNPGMLARVQRGSGLDSSAIALDGNDVGQTNVGGVAALDVPTPFASRFEVTLDRSNQQNNPHQNRFFAATRGLSHTHPNEIEGDQLDSTSRPERDHRSYDDLAAPHSASRIPDDDPRAYLMRHRQSVDGERSAAMTQTGLKTRRAKTFRLPFESIPVDDAIHDLAGILAATFPGTDTLSETCKSLSGVDMYLKSGQNRYLTWSAYATEVQHWEQTLQGLVTSLYRTRVGENGGVVPELDISLSRAIKAHVDGNH